MHRSLRSIKEAEALGRGYALGQRLPLIAGIFSSGAESAVLRGQRVLADSFERQHRAARDLANCVKVDHYRFIDLVSSSMNSKKATGAETRFGSPSGVAEPCAEPHLSSHKHSNSSCPTEAGAPASLMGVCSFTEIKELRADIAAQLGAAAVRLSGSSPLSPSPSSFFGLLGRVRLWLSLRSAAAVARRESRVLWREVHIRERLRLQQAVRSASPAGGAATLSAEALLAANLLLRTESLLWGSLSRVRLCGSLLLDHDRAKESPESFVEHVRSLADDLRRCAADVEETAALLERERASNSSKEGGSGDDLSFEGDLADLLAERIRQRHNDDDVGDEEEERRRGKRAGLPEPQSDDELRIYSAYTGPSLDRAENPLGAASGPAMRFSLPSIGDLKGVQLMKLGAVSSRIVPAPAQPAKTDHRSRDDGGDGAREPDLVKELRSVLRHRVLRYLFFFFFISL